MRQEQTKEEPEITQQAVASIAVVVSAFNEGPHIASCIDSLLVQTHPAARILLVDDGSSDNTLEVMRQYRDAPAVQILQLESNSGVPEARNRGLVCCAEEIIAFIDADGYAPENWLANLAPTFEDPTVGAAGGPDRLPEDASPFAQAVDYAMHAWLSSGRLRRDNPFTGYVPAGCNLWLRREALAGQQAFDSRLGQRGEEKELIQRIKRNGWNIAHEPRAWIWHRRRTNPRSFWRQCYLSGRARIDILRLAPDAFAWPHLAPLFITLLLAVAGVAATLDGGWGGAILGAYVLYLVAAALLGVIGGLTAAAAARVPLAIATLQLGYGCGSLRGLAGSLFGRPPGGGARSSPH